MAVRREAAAPPVSMERSVAAAADAPVARSADVPVAADDAALAGSGGTFGM
ncbi:hypothetical protein [Chitinasiproducens palmae]|uniref:hypothetical protein n=1 Tax=Chitinasiproducens palmae TaxID=1770053 RepID=UPI001F210E70|nr:hypothetical protein [Chitinasiproducens palmae]